MTTHTDPAARNRVLAAAAIARIVERYGSPLTLRQIKELAMPRSGWDAFAEVCVDGHRAGVLTMSRIDLPQVYGTAAQTGEIEISGSTFHWVKPRNYIG